MADSPEMKLPEERPEPNRRTEAELAARRAAGRHVPTPAERLYGAGRTLLWLVPMTILIWVYAEREQTVHPNGFNAAGVALRVTSTVADRFVELADGTRTVNLKLSGPQNGVQTVTQALAAGGLTIDLGSRRGTGPNQQVNVVDAVRDLPLLRQAGVSVDDSQPAELHVNVDTVEDRPAEVEADVRVQNLAGPATFDPPRVTLHGPTNQLKDLAAFQKRTDGKLRVTADLTKFADQLRQPGELRLTNVPLTLPTPEPDVTFSQPTVTAKLQVRAPNETYTIPAVPILVQASASTLAQYDVSLGESSVPYVRVTGPPDQVAAIRDKRWVVEADLKVNAGDFNQEQPRQLIYRGNLPPGVAVNPEDEARKVTFKLTRRDAPNGG